MSTLQANTKIFPFTDGEATEAAVQPTEQYLEYKDPLKLKGVKDEDLVETVDQYIRDSRKFFKKKNLYGRRGVNEQYYLGRQVKAREAQGKYKDHNVRYNDNIIWEAEATLKPIALSQVPELIVNAQEVKPEVVQAANSLTDWLNNDMKKREVKWVLGRAYRHRPIYFVGCVKWYWSPEHGDYRYECVHPNNIDVDHFSPDNNVDKMRWVAHHYPLSVKDMIIRFPEKKAKILEKVKAEMNISDDKTLSEKGMASMFKISEVWFTWYVQSKEDEDKWEKVEGVLWKYKDLLLNKMKNPNWDYEGQEQLFTFDDFGEPMRITENNVRKSIVEGKKLNGLDRRKVFKNYLPRPEKPFVFMGYDQLGLQPFDETSRIEQVILLQDSVDVRGRQISEMAQTASGKNVFSTEGGMTSEDVEMVDMTDPQQDILVKGDIRVVHRHIPGQQPQPSLFEEQQMSRARGFSKMGAHATTRGERDARETATGRQILREGDISRQDDEVSDTINYAAEKMARGALQFIKLRYTDEMLRKVLGKNGDLVFRVIQNDFVDDGMAVEATASAVQKRRRKEEAFKMAELQLIDPLSFFEDIEASQPTKRTKRLLMFNAMPEKYLQQEVFGGKGDGQVPSGSIDAAKRAMQDIAVMMNGNIPDVPSPLTPGYVQAINEFLQSEDFQSLEPGHQQDIQAFAQELLKRAEQQEAQAQSAQPPPQGSPPAGPPPGGTPPSPAGGPPPGPPPPTG